MGCWALFFFMLEFSDCWVLELWSCFFFFFLVWGFWVYEFWGFWLADLSVLFFGFVYCWVFEFSGLWFCFECVSFWTRESLMRLLSFFFLGFKNMSLWVVEPFLNSWVFGCLSAWMVEMFFFIFFLECLMLWVLEFWGLWGWWVVGIVGMLGVSFCFAFLCVFVSFICCWVVDLLWFRGWDRFFEFVGLLELVNCWVFELLGFVLF